MARDTVLRASREPFDLPAAVTEARGIASSLRAATSVEEAVACVVRWDRLRSDLGTWTSAISIRFRQVTTDPEAGAAMARIDNAAAEIEETRRVFLDALFSGDVPEELRSGITQRFGETCMLRWRSELRAFDPSVGKLLAEEQRLKSQHTALIGGGMVSLGGKEMTLSAAAALLTHEDRSTREAAATARWKWFAGARDELDGIFDELVRVRTAIAKGLGRDSFTEVGYDRMRRSDYNAQDVAAVRAAVAQHVVPLAKDIFRGQAERLALRDFAIWDEAIHGPGPSPRPATPPGDEGAPWLEAQAQGLFDDVDGLHGTKLGGLFKDMREAGLLDLAGRDAKGPGGFCAFLPNPGLPFIFANFNGTAGDARVFTHEMGHAYQGWSSAQNLPLGDQRRCTSETAEIHSMSLEFLTWPWMERLFGDGADRFRAEHFAKQVQFIPYGCAIDHFQHEVYANPGMTASERRGIWKDLEARYLPSRNWSGIPYGEEGSAWQAQLHIYQYPFYYIDYVLAQLVAFQFLWLSRQDAADAWKRYQRLCDLGGSLGFRELVGDVAGLKDPFATGSIEEIAQALRSQLAH